MILVTGLTGFTGRHVLDLLIRQKRAFRALVRRPDSIRLPADSGGSILLGDVLDPAIYRKALEGCDGIINLVSFGVGHVPLLLEEVRKAGVRRIMLIGTTAMFTTLNAASKAIRIQTEESIVRSGLDWTILRPTMIYGARGDRNFERLIRAIRRFRIHPVMGRGDRLMQPIHVHDLSRGILDAYSCTATHGRAFNLSGRDAVTYRGAVGIIARMMGVRPLLVPVPLGAALWAVTLASRIPGLPKIKREQVLRLNENKAFSHQEAADVWGFTPVSFESGIRSELQDLQEEIRPGG